ncbi:ROK family protein, partial [Mycoplasmoides pneumoniae]
MGGDGGVRHYPSGTYLWMVWRRIKKGGVMTTLAIDIGGTKLAAALIDKNLRISQRRELPTPASKTPDALREALKALVEPLRAEARQVAIASTG